MLRRRAFRAWRWGCGAAMLLAPLATRAAEPAVAAPAIQAEALISEEPRGIAPDDAAASDPQVEVIRERYANGAVKIERHMVRNQQGSFVLHGPWKMFDPDGHLLGGGEYRLGQRHGAWVRYFREGESELLSGALGSRFQAPFASHATFLNGQLHGTWTVVDAHDREVFSWEYEHGQRHGRSVWRFPNGQAWRELTLDHGRPQGDLVEWDPDGRLLAIETYENGRQLVTQVERYPSGAKRTEADCIAPEELTETIEDWWDGVSRTRRIGSRGATVRHGRWIVYFENGQKAMEGSFDRDVPVGKFTWWHANAQRAIEGEYVSGQQHGPWTWWHSNGQVHIQGRYAHGVQDGAWSWWTADNELVYSVKLADAPLHVVEQNPPANGAEPALLGQREVGDAPSARTVQVPEPALAPTSRR